MLQPINKKSLDKTVEEGKILIDRHSVIFFDAFDTLITRDCSKPTDVFDLVERRAKQKGSQIRYFRDKRIEAERVCAQKITASTLDDIYSFLSVEDKEMLKELEIDTEKKVSIKKYIGYRLYNYAKAQKKRIAVVSDMYLSAKTIRELLDSAGYEIEFVFVSCEHYAEKYNGELFRIALRQMCITQKDVVHFGDNYISDIIGATRAGIASMRIPPQPQLAYFKNSSNPFADRYLLPFITNRVPLIENKAEALGYEICGPMIVGFCQWLHERLHKEGYQKALFCARDMLQTLQIYLNMYPEDVDLVCYFYVSRKSLEQAYFAAVGTDKSDEATKQLLYLRKYLSQTGCKGKVALVDSGLHGRSQKMLNEIINRSFELHGMYIRVSKEFERNVLDPESRVYMNPDRPDVRHTISSMLFETMIAAVHGRTLKYNEMPSGKVVPELGKGHPSSFIIERLQKGNNQFAQDYIRSIYKNERISEVAIREPILRFAFAPKPEDVDSMGDILCGNEKYEYLIIKKERKHYLSHPLDVLIDLKDTYWKGGYLVYVFPRMYPIVSWIYLKIDCIILSTIGKWGNEKEPE